MEGEGRGSIVNINIEHCTWTCVYMSCAHNQIHSYQLVLFFVVIALPKLAETKCRMASTVFDTVMKMCLRDNLVGLATSRVNPVIPFHTKKKYIAHIDECRQFCHPGPTA